MRPIGLLIFDLDGTLVNTLEDITASVNYTLGQLGRASLGTDTVRQYIGNGIENLMEQALGSRAGQVNEAVVLYKEHHHAHLMDRSVLYPGVQEMLEHFRALPMAVISNKTGAFIRPILKHLCIDTYFKRVVGAHEGLPLKPAPDAIWSIMAEYGVPRDRTAIIGDGTTDVQSGKAAGIITCAVTYGYRSEEELKLAMPDYLIHDLRELRMLFAPDPSDCGAIY